MYTYLKQRFAELQKYSLIQESKIEECNILMNELFGKIAEEHEAKETEIFAIKSPDNRVVHSPQAEGRVINSPKAEGRVINSPRAEGRVINSPRAEGRVVSSPRAEGRVINSPRAEGRVVSSPRVEGLVIHSPPVKGRVVHSSQIEGRVVDSPKQKGRVVHSPVSYHRRTPVGVEQSKVTSPEHVMRLTTLDEDDDFKGPRSSPELQSPVNEEYEIILKKNRHTMTIIL
eukprot:TCONS_00031401-protein